MQSLNPAAFSSFVQQWFIPISLVTELFPLFGRLPRSLAGNKYAKIPVMSESYWKDDKETHRILKSQLNQVPEKNWRNRTEQSFILYTPWL